MQSRRQFLTTLGIGLTLLTTSATANEQTEKLLNSIIHETRYEPSKFTYEFSFIQKRGRGNCEFRFRKTTGVRVKITTGAYSYKSDYILEIFDKSEDRKLFIPGEIDNIIMRVKEPKHNPRDTPIEFNDLTLEAKEDVKEKYKKVLETVLKKDATPSKPLDHNFQLEEFYKEHFEK